MIKSGIITPYNDYAWIVFHSTNGWQGEFFFLEEIDNGANATTSDTTEASSTSVQTED